MNYSESPAVSHLGAAIRAEGRRA